MYSNYGAGNTLERPLDTKEIKPVNPKGNQPWILFGKTDAEALILWPPDVNSRLTGKDSTAGRRRKGRQRMVGWHHRFNGHELGQTLGDDEGQGGLTCGSPMGRKESDTTWRLNDNINKTDNQQESTYSTGNYTQHFVIIYKGKDPDKQYVYIYIKSIICYRFYIYVAVCIYTVRGREKESTESLCCTCETNTKSIILNK